MFVKAANGGLVNLLMFTNIEVVAAYRDGADKRFDVPESWACAAALPSGESVGHVILRNGTEAACREYLKNLQESLYQAKIFLPV